MATYSPDGKQLISNSLPLATARRTLNGRTILTFNDQIGGSTGDYADHSIFLRTDRKYEVKPAPTGMPAIPAAPRTARPMRRGT